MYTALKYQKGSVNADPQGQTVPMLHGEWPVLFKTHHTTDRYFVNYALRDTPALPLARLQKQCTDPRVVCTTMALDYDNPGHAAWTPDTLTEFLGLVQKTDFGLFAGWSAFYTTRHGARFFYVLDKPLTPDEYEATYKWVVSLFPLPVDQRTWDWTRLFRLPFVTRDTGPTWQNPLITCNITPRPSGSGSWGRLTRVITPGATDTDTLDDKPPPHVTTGLLADPATNKKTPFYRHAQRKLKNHAAYGVLFGTDPVAAPGARNTRMHQLAGVVAKALWPVDAQQIYALLYPAALRLTPDTATQDWTNEAWRSAKKVHAAEATAHADRLKSRAFAAALAEQQRVKTKDAIGWLPADTTPAQLAGMAVIAAQAGYYVLGPDGFYNPTPAKKLTIRPHIKRLGVEHLIPLEKPSPKDPDVFIPRPDDEIIRDHSINVVQHVARFGIRGIQLDFTDPDAPVAVHPMTRLTTTPPKHDVEIDTWLRALFGGFYDYCAMWLGWSLAVTAGPIPALSLESPPGCGKNVLARGLASCFVGGHPLATGEDLCGAHSYGMAYSPIIHVDEAWPKRLQTPPADELRRLLGECLHRVNRKYQDPLTVHCAYRILMTANDDTLINGLRTSTLSKHARGALAQRVSHIQLDDGGARFFAALGARDRVQDWFTSGRITQHFMWLYHNRGRDANATRYCIGTTAGNTIKTLLRMDPDTEIVAAVVLGLLTRPGQQIAWVDKQPWVRATTINEALAEKHINWGLRKINRALANLQPDTPTGRVRFPNGKRYRAVPLDLPLLKEIAETQGVSIHVPK